MVTHYNKFFGDPQISIEIELVKKNGTKIVAFQVLCIFVFVCLYLWQLPRWQIKHNEEADNGSQLIATNIGTNCCDTLSEGGVTFFSPNTNFPKGFDL